MFTAGSSMAIDYAPELQKYLQDTFKVEIEQTEPYTLRTPSNIIIYVKKSKTPLWYGLDKAVYDKLATHPRFYMAIVMGTPKTTFVIPKSKVIEIFNGIPTKPRHGLDRERWHFKIDSSHHLKFNNVDKTQEIEVYLNHWDSDR